ncbi:hypothetical protein BGW36DRAFT_388588 [Talaromyces proteolyticus]|uniref:Histone deacetylase complex subunit SAP30 Sin3 binding domain-containing protein n=1 Tax=Talaromyces proteolyticus TaxID=1131652 RepID=A0AAD4PTZ5_9EURO|nr:uncharacterized protein BGW36DRAFT_388588 [Talaromyces proteolyticus]KAH8691565.1 hypothetical protein BGW36DRAFT_388588 [Talaromyces proteolyticus]
MAPPRQRLVAGTTTAGSIDDSRSEASSGTAAGNNPSRGPGSKPRKSGVALASGAGASAKDLKVAAASGAMAAAAAAAAANAALQDEDNGPSIPWSQMPLSILHDYRHAYKISSASAYSKPISKLLLSSGIGLRSPTSIAARKAELASSAASSTSTSSSSRSNLNPNSGNRRGGDDQDGNNNDGNHNSSSRGDNSKVLHKIIGQGRVGKNQLALAVRKHFNAAGLVEQEAIARFLYKVREEGKGREFRLRFQP